MGCVVSSAILGVDYRVQLLMVVVCWMDVSGVGRWWCVVVGSLTGNLGSESVSMAVGTV